MPEREVNKAESAGQQRPKEEVTPDSHSNNTHSVKTLTQTETQNKKIENKRKPQKRKNADMETDVYDAVATQEKEKETKSNKVEKGATESFESKVDINHQQHQTPAKRLKPELSKEQSLKRQQLRKLLNRQETDQRESPAEQKEEPTVPEEEVKPDRSASLRSRMEQRLEAARFRYINEVLYSTSSGEATRMFRQDPQAFRIYHSGYTAQVQKWPVNPVDLIISYIRQKWAMKCFDFLRFLTECCEVENVFQYIQCI